MSSSMNGSAAINSSRGMEKKKYPVGPEHYTLYEEIGHGVSASVHRALCIPLNEIVAIKILDFERVNSDLSNISREAQTMMLVDHPNILKSHCSFVNDHTLWVIMPFMSGGSCLHILKATHPDGFEEVIIATILRGVLRSLEYLHNHGHIHRDVKAGNILIDGSGAIKLGDFGVSACLFDSGDRQRVRNTFVGTPCWMAPEVMEQLHGYDFKADIWSFGITALELAHGHAPFSIYPPLKVLLMTLQNTPPGLDYERDKKFSKSFRQMIASCLVKEPSKRPTAAKLLKHYFFKQARSNEYIARKLLEGLPALGDRIMELKRKEQAKVAEKKTPDGEMEEISQNEYKRGISGWNFNLDDLKAQVAAMDDQELIPSHDQELVPSNDQELVPAQPTSVFDASMNNDKDKHVRSDDESIITSSSGENYLSQSSSPRHIDHGGKHMEEVGDEEVRERLSETESLVSDNGKQISSGIVAGRLLTCQSDKQQNHVMEDASSGVLARFPKQSGNNEELDDKNKVPVVQRKGRFKVTSENVDLEKVSPSPTLQKSQSLQALARHPGVQLAPSSDAVSSSAPLSYTIFPMLHTFLHANIMQRESILNLMRHLSTGELAGVEKPPNVAANEKSMLEAAHEREKEYLHEITELQWRLLCAQEELQKYRTENGQV